MSNYQIVIPMSGFGERFRRAGYDIPKPLIEIEGKPIIAHVIDMFPGETDFIFICNQDHLDTSHYHMAEALARHCPSGRVLGIAPHKLGPVHAVRQAEAMIDPARPVIVNYCDFTCFWDWEHFKAFVAHAECDGALPAYRFFHPHTLGTTNYAYIRETNGWAYDIQEKQPFTENRMDEYASSGTYYFASGKIMSDAFSTMIAQKLELNGEYYVSLAYKPLLETARPVAVYDLQHFMQWGTPEDVAEYNGWSAAFHTLGTTDDESKPGKEYNGTLIVPMAGLGQRFAKEGYHVTKPLIQVSGKPMVIQAAADMPSCRRHAFVLRTDMPGADQVRDLIANSFPNVTISTVPQVTEGQACTAMIGVDDLEKVIGEITEPITFCACDNGTLYDSRAFEALMEDESIDVIVWGARGYANAVRRPEMFGWIDADNGVVRGISVKKPLHDPLNDPIVIGTFTFRRAEDFRRSVNRMIERDGRVNNEFYLDTCINDAIALGLRCRLFEIDSYLSWGTPNDLKTFEYWQSCFHKWSGHPYRLENDRRVAKDQLEALKARFAAQVPSMIDPKSR